VNGKQQKTQNWSFPKTRKIVKNDEKRGGAKTSMTYSVYYIYPEGIKGA
jgi:hypothetical protein